MLRILLFPLILVLAVTGCAESFTTFHSRTGEPILIGRRAYSYEGCLSTLREEASRLGATFRYVHIRGTTVGRSLLWPIEPGYACEAAIGPPQAPNGSYFNVPPLDPPTAG
jgi:hypothetical protein